MSWWAVLTGTIKALVNKGETGKHSSPSSTEPSTAMGALDKSVDTENTTQAASMLSWQEYSVHFTMSCLQFGVNTLVHIMEQGIALQQAVPMLVQHQEGNKIAQGMWYVLTHDIAPVLLLHTLSHQTRDYFPPKDSTSNTALFLWSGAWTLGQCAIQVYTWKKSAETLVHIATLDAFAPAIFNANKKSPPSSFCDSQECSTSRRIKGMGRELGILWANELLIGGIHYLPYAGAPMGQLLKIINHGRYITRVVTPERCEDHKFMSQEFVLAVGLLFELTSQFLDKGLSATTGSLPFIYVRALRHLLLALHVNMAAHSKVPLVLTKGSGIDLFDYYEQSARFGFDVLWAGLLKRIPIDFKSKRSALLSPVFQGGVYLFNYDLEYTAPVKKSSFHYMMKQWMVPKMFHSAHDFVNDPVFAPHWPRLCNNAIFICKTIEQHGNSTTVKVMQWSPETAAYMLELSPLQLPRQVTKTVLMLCKESDFWELTQAIKAWFQRHQIKVEMKLLPVNESYALLDNAQGQEQGSTPPSSPKQHVTIPASQLMPRSQPLHATDEEPSFKKEQRKEAAVVSATPATLFAAKRNQNTHTLDPYALGFKKKVS